MDEDEDEINMFAFLYKTVIYTGSIGRSRRDRIYCMYFGDCFDRWSVMRAGTVKTA